MAELDLTFCSKGEYEAGRENIVHESEFELDSIYSAMYLLGRPGLYEAAIVPARIIKLNTLDVGRTVLFAALDVDLRPTAHINGTFTNGYMDVNAARTVVSRHAVTGLYFKDYMGGTWDMRELEEALSLSASM